MGILGQMQPARGPDMGPDRKCKLTPSSGPDAARTFSGRFALVAVVAAAVLSFNFGSRLPLTNHDTRCPVMARDVLVNGHWLVPALPDGTPHLVKPPLVVWLIALTSWPAGSVSVRTAVLPSLLAAIGVALLTYWLGRRLFHPHARGGAGFVPLRIVLVDPITPPGIAGLKRLLSIPGWIVLAALAVP